MLLVCQKKIVTKYKFMNSNFSTTQLSNIAIIAGMVVIVAKNFDFVISMEDATTVVSFFVVISAAISSYINKHRKGETTLLGSYKK